MTRRSFFIGWSPASARPIAAFLIVVAASLLIGAGALAVAIGSRVDDPGGGTWIGDRSFTGTLIEHPYPIVVTDPDAAHPAGHAVILTGGGKRGAQDPARGLNGRRVTATGGLVKRGDIDMLLVADIKPATGPAAAVTGASLGTWRVVGEICDGKCVSGVMRPGQGLAHKACASVCILGGVPPILVTTAPVAGRGFMLMGTPDNQALPDSFRDSVGVPRRMDGTVERIADLLIFRTDVARASVP